MQDSCGESSLRDMHFRTIRERP